MFNLCFAFQREVLKSRNKQVVQLFEHGVGVHHAGMLRADRGLTERLFSGGLLKVSICTLRLVLLIFIFGVFLTTLCINASGTGLHSNFGMGSKSTCSHCGD